MKRKNHFIMTEEELFENCPKAVIASEGLTVVEHKNMLNYLKSLEKDNKIQSLGFRNKRGGKDHIFSIGFTIHECLLRYPRGNEKNMEKCMEIGNACEFLRILPADAVFCFVGNKNPIPYKGRLWERIETLGKPIVFFARNKNNDSWFPYKCCQFIFDEDKEEQVEDWFFIGEIEENCLSEDNDECETSRTIFRHFSENEMTEREYAIASECIRINNACLGLTIEGFVRREDKLSDTATLIAGEVMEIFSELQCNEKITEEQLKIYEARLDFLKANIEEI